MLKGMIIGLSKKEKFEEIKKYIESYIPKINNWALCDVFCAGLKITSKYEKEMWQFIQKYLKSDKEFEIRFGVVIILDYYIKEEYLEEIFKIIEKIENDGYYVKMAIAWEISISLIKYYDRTKEFLQKSQLDKFTHNKAIQKAIESYRITEKQKAELRKMKR